jgi:hypothetical protein
VAEGRMRGDNSAHKINNFPLTLALSLRERGLFSCYLWKILSSGTERSQFFAKMICYNLKSNAPKEKYEWDQRDVK